MRAFNFSAGPSALPEPVLQQAASEMLDWHGSGVSVMEMSHRSKQFMQIRDEAEADLRTLLAIPADFEVLFLQGGATAQNALVPLNLAARSATGKADYVLSGQWANKSYTEAQRFADTAVAASAGQAREIGARTYKPWCWLPESSTWQVRPDAAYLHVCANETIGGVELAEMPDMAALGAPEVPLVVDMSSNILSRALDFSRLGMVYAGAQKNAGSAGVTLVIVRKDLLDYAASTCPSVFNLQLVAKAQSLLNTPPTYAIYISGLVFKWLLQQGGVAAMDALSSQKASLLYSYIDSSQMYHNPVYPAVRSRMNVPFILHSPGLDQHFLNAAHAAGLLALKGHKSVGGMRASIYNAMPLQGVQALVAFMQDFEARHG